MVRLYKAAVERAGEDGREGTRSNWSWALSSEQKEVVLYSMYGIHRYTCCTMCTQEVLSIEGVVGQTLEDRYTEVCKLRAIASGSLS